ncbi:hypothetical protein NKR23_g8934 [Pleurostoma richardsiae]|uniref:Uncharacterized protein n=1 Tax=Pleurostoma richardsiae TaxID=41990 RepID=A0AA38RIE6_9PEZI|nr:hypothetical protein NKR23_g8934 [Pleurostoma richardsiae]
MNANVVPLPEGGPIKPEVGRYQNDGTSRVRDSSTQDVDSMLPSLSSSKLPFQPYFEIALRPVDVGRPLMRARSPSVDDPDLFRVSTPTHTPSPSLASCTSDDEGSTTSYGTTMDRYTWMNERIYPNTEMFGRTWRPVDRQFQKILELIELGCVHVAPVRDPRKMLEIGTGTGCWGHDFALAYPNSDVIGTDTACPQRETQWPQHGPTQPNFHLEIHDWNKEWNRKHCHFDLIFARIVDRQVKIWPKLAAEIYACLKPGAWFEGRERSFFFSDAHGRPLRRGSAWSYITNEIQRLGSWTGYSFNITESGNYATCLAGAGFVNIRVFQDEVFGSHDYRWQDQQQQLYRDLLAESDDVMVIVAQKPTSVPSDLEPNVEVPTKDLSEDPGCCFVRRALGDILSAFGPAYAKYYE